MNKDSLWQFLLFCLVYQCAAWFFWSRPYVKVLEQNSNKLLFHLRPFRPWVCGVGIGGAGLIALVGSIRMAKFTELCVSGFIVFLSLLVMELSPFITCTFDKQRDRMAIKRQSLFGKKNLKHSINEILDVEVEHSSTDEGMFYRVTLTLSSGENVLLTNSYSSDLEKQQGIANLIRNFLNLGRQKPKE